MCGIAGMAGPGAAEVVRAMTGALVHRGPDDGGHYDDPAARLCLGMRRLSILDLAHGHQPMANPEQSVWIVYNGEIFNSPDLRRGLEERGHRFHTANSDTETLLRLYDEKQEGMLAELNGMFAFVLHDKRRNLLFGARDRVGIKPLYYARRPDAFAFASELKSLLRMPGLARTLDEKQPFPLPDASVRSGDGFHHPGRVSACAGSLVSLRLEDRPIRNPLVLASFICAARRSVGGGME
jgi:asparagine synthase (glutamine-hydrolysing)